MKTLEFIFYIVLLIIDFGCLIYFIREFKFAMKSDWERFPKWFLVFAIVLGVIVTGIQTYVVFNHLPF